MICWSFGVLSNVSHMEIVSVQEEQRKKILVSDVYLSHNLRTHRSLLPNTKEGDGKS